jgi:transmembrane sensor
MTAESFKELLARLSVGKLTREQGADLSGLLHDPARREELEGLIPGDLDAADIEDVSSAKIRKLMFQHVRLRIAEPPIVGKRPFPLYYWVAAAMVGVLVAGGWWWMAQRAANTKPTTANVFRNDVAPGGNHAVLTLANGMKVVLDSVMKGKLADQGKMEVLKMDSNRVEYRPVGGGYEGSVYNTLSTPTGGQSEVILADGTRVWLNALSSLRFPTDFSGTNRTVELTGEGYFEVARNKAKPFYVRAKGVDVQVLGTSFDVNAYMDDSTIRTSLLEGSVKLERSGANLELKPGQQGKTVGAAGLAVVPEADMDVVLAWRKGIFRFDEADIEAVMKQLSRWYGIDVKYTVNPTGGSYGGSIGRDLTLTQVLNGLNLGGVHFRLEGKTLTVTP